MNCEALGLMYEVTNDPAILNEMISFADAFVALRNDYTDRRVMWTGNVEPVWLTTTTSSSDPGYAGCENNDIVGHIAYCAKLILQTPSLWNATVPDGNPHGYGATYLQRAQAYVTRMEQVQDQYMNTWFIDFNTYRIKDSTVVDPRFAALGQSTTAWNRQMMFINGWQRLSECHAILGDNPGKVGLYDAICQASVSWFQTEWTSTTGGGQTCYVWDYAPSYAGGNEEMNLHADYDIWGLGRTFDAGKYGLSESSLRPFAETLRYIIYQQGTTYTFAEWVNGDTSKTRNYIYPAWMFISAWDPCTFDIMAQADINQGSQGSTAIFDALILWTKNARYLGIYPSNCDAADFSLTSPWVEKLAAGTSTNYPVTVNSLYGFGAGGVSLSMSGLPSGVSASFSPGANSTLTISATAAVPTGVYAATISGTGSGITRTLPITLVVTNAAVPNFAVTGAPSSQNITIGGGTTYSVNIASLNGFSGTVALSVSGLPAHASGSFSPSSVSGGSGSSTLTITTATNTPSGNFTVTITGTSGSLINSTNVTLLLNDFTVTSTPGSQSVPVGGGTNYTITIGNINAFGGTVTLSASGLPSGASASFNPSSVNSLGNSTMTVTTATNTPASTNTLTITGTCGSLMHSATATLIVNRILPSWTLVNDTASSVAYSSGWTYGTNRNLGDYNNDVHYTTGASNYATFTFTGTGVEYITETYSDEGNVDVYMDGTYQNTVNCNTSTRQAQVPVYSNTGLSSGSHTIKVVKNSGSYMLVDAFGYTTAPVPDFSISTMPSSQSTAVGGGVSYTTTVTATNGFSGSVSFSVSGLPTGASASFSPTSVSGSGSSTLSVSTSGSTPAGSYTLTVTGTSGSLVHSSTVTLIVTDFTVSVTPSSQTVTAGNSTNYTATISALNGFNGSVSFTVSGLPSGASASFSPTSVTGSGSSTMTVSTTTNTPASTNTLTVTGTSGSLVHSASVTLIVKPVVTGGLPSGWTDIDIGSPSPAGSASYSGGVFTVNGGGSDIWGTSDQFNYAYESVSGDTTIIARVATVQNTQSSAKTGVMIRETTAAGSTYASCYITPSSGAKFECRTATGGSAALVGSQSGIAAPYWVKMVRSGSTFTASISPDGNTWTTIGTTNISMASSVNVGLPVCSHASGTLCTATLDNVSVTLPWNLVNDTDSGITYSSGWSYSSGRGDGDYDDDVHYTTGASNYAQYTFTGTSAEYITETYSDEGNVDVYIDGTFLTTVNCNSSTRAAQVVMYSTSGLTYGSHTIKVVKNSGSYMLLDAFGYR